MAAGASGSQFAVVGEKVQLFNTVHLAFVELFRYFRVEVDAKPRISEDNPITAASSSRK